MRLTCISNKSNRYWAIVNITAYTIERNLQIKRKQKTKGVREKRSCIFIVLKKCIVLKNILKKVEDFWSKLDIC